jgi:glucose/mannose-6-phosphate isomerase
MSPGSLDAPEIYGRLDPEGLGERIAALPDQIEQAWKAGADFALPASYRNARRVLVLGMGGSGIGGALVAGLASDLGAPTPVSVARGYTLPGWVDSSTLVIASSNSGNTEETLAAFEAALAAGALCVVSTTGGRLARIANEREVPALAYEWSGEPRSALGWSFAALLAVLGRLGLTPDLGHELHAATGELRRLRESIGRESPESANPAKELARRLGRKLPVIIGSQALATVAYRWRTQMNENAKSWAVYDELPELNHNAQAGYGFPREVLPLLHVLLLRHAAVHPRVALRFDATADEIRANGIAVEVIDVEGGDLVAQVLRAVYLGDYVSYYLGLLNGVHPSPVEPLERLKKRLTRPA